jgi:methionyl-tRNA synthetase
MSATAPPAAPPAVPAATPKQAIITCAPPNPNGDLHLGHLSGPFLGSDVLRRYLVQTGRRVVHVSYMDDFSCYVTRRGRELGETTERTAHAFGRRMEETLSLAGMLPDYVTHPLRERRHARAVQRHFRRLWRDGAFEVVDLPTFWCERCQAYLYEAEVRGRCQFCHEPSDGVYCEECGLPQDTAGLAEPACTRCRERPEIRPLRRIAFDLERYRERLREHYAGRDLRPSLRRYLDDLFSRPLPLTAVSRQSDFGVPVPLAGWEGHVLDTWYSGIWGYVAATEALLAATGDRGAARRWWSDPDTAVVHFIGFDCSFSHAVLWPALFLAHGGFRLPEHVITNEFYLLEGDKFSTSRGHALWGGDVLARLPADPVRFFLCLTGPEREKTNFSGKEFSSVVNGVLVNQFQQWLDTVLSLVQMDLGGRAPAAEPAGPDAVRRVSARLPVEVAGALELPGFSLRRAAETLAEAIGVVAADAPGLRAARGDRDTYHARLALHLEVLARIAATAAPIMPATAAHLWGALGLPTTDPLRSTLPWPAAGARLVPEGSPVAAPLMLFQPLEV